MGNRDHNSSFTGCQTDDSEELVMECLSTLEVVRHLFRGPGDDPLPDADVLNGVSHIVTGVMATLETIYEQIATEAQDRRLRSSRPMAAHREGVAAFKRRWGEEAARDMYWFILKHYGFPREEEEGSSGEADDARDTSQKRPASEADDADDERDPDWYLDAFEVGATTARQYPHTPIPDLFAVREALNKKWRAKGGPRPEDAREYVTVE